MAWRWKNPKGETGYAQATQAAAIDEAIRKATGQPQPRETCDKLWAGLVRAGWRLTEE